MTWITLTGGGVTITSTASTPSSMVTSRTSGIGHVRVDHNFPRHDGNYVPRRVRQLQVPDTRLLLHRPAFPCLRCNLHKHRATLDRAVHVNHHRISVRLTNLRRGNY